MRMHMRNRSGIQSKTPTQTPIRMLTRAQHRPPAYKKKDKKKAHMNASSKPHQTPPMHPQPTTPSTLHHLNPILAPKQPRLAMQSQPRKRVIRLAHVVVDARPDGVDAAAAQVREAREERIEEAWLRR